MLPAIRDDIRARYALVREWMQRSEFLEWVEPKGGVVCFPRLRHPERHDMELFYRVLYDDYSTYVGPGHWFSMPRHYFRLGYGWPGVDELSQGLANIDGALKDSLRY